MKSSLKKLRRKFTSTRLIKYLVIVIIAFVGVRALTLSMAAPFTYSFEAESSSRTGVTVVDETGTSGDRAIKFGSGGGVGVDRIYSWHTNITATTFWVGENFRSAADGSQVCSAYDGEWAKRWAPAEDTVSTLIDSTDCSGAPIGGCDGVRGALVTSGGRRIVTCTTENRTAANDYYPSWATTAKLPRENPFYLDLPYNDISEGFSGRCAVIPWANDPGFAGKCNDRNFSYMKNRWVEIVGPNGNTCYGQIQDAGPSDDESSDPLKYRDAPYVFGTNDARPSNQSWNSAGMDVSPALNGCLGFADLDGSGDKVRWRWIEAQNVPAGPWKKVITTSQVNW